MEVAAPEKQELFFKTQSADGVREARFGSFLFLEKRFAD